MKRLIAVSVIFALGLALGLSAQLQAQLPYPLATTQPAKAKVMAPSLAPPPCQAGAQPACWAGQRQVRAAGRFLA